MTTGYPVPRRGFRWTCPLCGDSRLNRSTEESGRRNAASALRTHVVASGGGPHGPVGGYPDGFDPSTVPDHVVRVDDGRRAAGPER